VKLAKGLRMTEQEALTELRRRFDEDTANTVYRLNGLLMERDAEIKRLKAELQLLCGFINHLCRDETS
jgi:hypothetical protein